MMMMMMKKKKKKKKKKKTICNIFTTASSKRVLTQVGFDPITFKLKFSEL
jgi:hypothetical protein